MEQALPLEQLTARLFAVERETAQLRRDLAQFRPTHTRTERLEDCFLSPSEQLHLAETMEQLFSDLSIQVPSIGAKNVQELMRQANLEPNELSRGIIEMRDE